jgi:hypothetical protein
MRYAIAMLLLIVVATESGRAVAPPARKRGTTVDFQDIKSDWYFPYMREDPLPIGLIGDSRLPAQEALKPAVPAQPVTPPIAVQPWSLVPYVRLLLTAIVFLLVGLWCGRWIARAEHERAMKRLSP